jgi:hypothetical protein
MVNPLHVLCQSTGGILDIAIYILKKLLGG